MMFFFFFFNDTATTEIYTLSLHDALPIWDFDDVVVDFQLRRVRRDGIDAAHVELEAHALRREIVARTGPQAEGAAVGVVGNTSRPGQHPAFVVHVAGPRHGQAAPP